MGGRTVRVQEAAMVDQPSVSVSLLRVDGESLLQGQQYLILVDLSYLLREGSKGVHGLE